MSALYRVRQFVQAVGAYVGPLDTGLAHQYLPPQGIALFAAMPRYDQQHALCVCRALVSRGRNEPDLLAAALLHDVGKTAKRQGVLHLWHRVTVVLLVALAPRLLESLAQDSKARWRRPFYTQRYHASIGAELAREAGCSVRTVALIRDHEMVQNGEKDPLLTALQKADSVN